MTAASPGMPWHPSEEEEALGMSEDEDMARRVEERKQARAFLTSITLERARKVEGLQRWAKAARLAAEESMAEDLGMANDEFPDDFALPPAAEVTRGGAGGAGGGLPTRDDAQLVRLLQPIADAVFSFLGEYSAGGKQGEGKDVTSAASLVGTILDGLSRAKKRVQDTEEAAAQTEALAKAKEEEAENVLSRASMDYLEHDKALAAIARLKQERYAMEIEHRSQEEGAERALAELVQCRADLAEANLALVQKEAAFQTSQGTLSVVRSQLEEVKEERGNLAAMRVEEIEMASEHLHKEIQRLEAQVALVSKERDELEANQAEDGLEYQALAAEAASLREQGRKQEGVMTQLTGTIRSRDVRILELETKARELDRARHGEAGEELRGREQAIVQREMDLERRREDMAQREADLERRKEAIVQREEELERRREAMSLREADLLKRQAAATNVGGGGGAGGVALSEGPGWDDVGGWGEREDWLGAQTEEPASPHRPYEGASPEARSPSPPLRRGGVGPDSGLKTPSSRAPATPMRGRHVHGGVGGGGGGERRIPAGAGLDSGRWVYAPSVRPHTSGVGASPGQRSLNIRAVRPGSAYPGRADGGHFEVREVGAGDREEVFLLPTTLSEPVLGGRTPAGRGEEQGGRWAGSATPASAVALAELTTMMIADHEASLARLGSYDSIRHSRRRPKSAAGGAPADEVVGVSGEGAEARGATGKGRGRGRGRGGLPPAVPMLQAAERRALMGLYHSRAPSIKRKVNLAAVRTANPLGM